MMAPNGPVTPPVLAINRLRLDYEGLYPVLTLSMVLVTYAATAALGGSGFLAVYLTGIVIGNRRPVFHRGILLFHDAVAWICQILMFMTLAPMFSSATVELGAGS